MLGRYSGILEYLFGVWVVAVLVIVVGFWVASWWFGRKKDWMD